MKMNKHLLEAVAVLTLVIQVTYSQTGNGEWYALTCTHDFNCSSVHAHSICGSRPPTNPDGTPGDDQLVCTCPLKYIIRNTSNPADPTGPCVLESDYFSTQCDVAQDCTDAGHRNAECVVRNIVLDQDGVVDELLRCMCRDNWMPYDVTDPDAPDGICQLYAQLGEECDPTREPPDSICVADNSACVDDGYNQGTKRCACADGFFMFNDPISGTHICARSLKAQDYAVCEDCEQNKGHCYATTTNVTLLNENPEDNYECKCPITKVRSEEGVDCGKSLADVMCNVTAFTMTVCYAPHARITNPDFLMYADQFGTLEACKGVVIDPNNYLDVHGCPEGSERKLVLDLKSDRLGQCGVQEYKQVQTITFEKTIVVQNNSGDSSMMEGGIFFFDVFCRMTTLHEGSFEAFGVRPVPGNDQGEHLLPSIDFKVMTKLGRELADGVSLRLGDTMRLRIELEADGTYAAIMVQRCTASTSFKIPDEDADTAALLIDSCPVRGQTVITEDTIWRMVSNKPNILETGLLPTFKLPRGLDVFIHCTVKLCLEGDEAECAPVKCDDTHANSAGRKKRATEENTDLVRKITIEDPNEATSDQVAMDKTGFGLMLGVLLLILIILCALVVVLILKLRSRGTYVEDFGAPPKKPQRFAMPRIGNAAMRM